MATHYLSVHCKEKKVSEKGFEGFSGGRPEGFTALQKTVACYLGGFGEKRFFSFIFQQ